MTKITQNLILEGTYSKIGQKILNNATSLALYVLKRKQPTPGKPPYYLFTNQLGKNGYISSMYPITQKYGLDIDKTTPPEYMIEYKGVAYKYTEYPTQVIIELTPNLNLTF